MEHPKLKKISKVLNNFFSYFKDDNILVVAEDKSVLPFLYIISDNTASNALLLSIAVDYPNAVFVADVVLKCSPIAKLALSEAFYIDAEGKTHFGPEAYVKWDLDNVEFTKVKPISEKIH